MSVYYSTALAMLAFAANSVLCRMALGENTIDAASFTSIRLLSGALMLALLVVWRNSFRVKFKFNFLSSLMLFTYAICFSFSYIGLTTGTGALILFASVQLTMILYGLFKGERPVPLAWAGILAAFGGLVWLLLPGVSAPPPGHALMMLIAGIAWGIYSLRGQSISEPLRATAINFIGTLPFALVVIIIFQTEINLALTGIILAILSGAIASGLGYAIWYSALTHLKSTSAASVQLSVPVIAAIAGVLLMAEPLSLRLIVSSLVVLGGIYLTIRSKQSS